MPHCGKTEADMKQNIVQGAGDNSRYLVKTKYTYERVPQSDYSYRPDFLPWSWADGRIQSHNAIPPLYRRETRLSLGEHCFSAERPVELTLSDEAVAALAASSALSVTPAADTPATEELIYRATFFGADGESFSSVGTAAAGRTDSFSLSRMDFTPTRLKLETVGAALTAAIASESVWNTLGEWGGQAHFYRPLDATLTDRGSDLALTVEGRGGFSADSLPQEAGGCYSMLMPRRNTIFMILSNPDGLDRATLSFTSETSPHYTPENAVTLPLPQDSAPHALYFNLSACPGCAGRLTGYRLEVEGHGTLLIHGWSFEQEKPLEEPRATITAAIADPANMTLRVAGHIRTDALLDAYSGGRLCLYAATMADAQGLGASQESTAGKTLVGTLPLPRLTSTTVPFELDGLSLCMQETTLLPYQLLLFAEADGQPPLCLSDRFYIENYEAFDGNPYAFDLPSYTLSVLDCGARGDAIHDDTAAIQAAIDRVSAAGGGQVYLPGSTDRYGRRYIVTSLLLRDNVELHLGDGAVLWQSPRRDDYPYQPSLGHDGVIPGINWTHSLHVSNLPLIQGANLSHIKITGRGSIRMQDTASEEGVDMPGYSVGCYRRIHCIPLGLFLCDYVETRDFEIIRASNYHTEYNHCRHVYIANTRLHEVKCVSGDGFGMAGAQEARVNRCFLQSNDDGIVMSCHYYDPRGLLWWTNLRDEDNSCRDITVLHSYLNSGGGKALAFITWGTGDPIQEREEISHVVATDNILMSVNPVGTWPDNPYAGKQPFDNTETDDYSPVKDIRIYGNRYVGNCKLSPVHVTNILTDCGITSGADFRNGDFSLGGLANWTLWHNAAPDSIDTVIYADKEKGRIRRFGAGAVAAAQGLHLLMGQHTFTCELMTAPDGVELFVARIPAPGRGAEADPYTQGDILLTKQVVCPRPQTVSLSFELTEEESDLFVGLRSPASPSADGFAIFDHCRMESRVDTAALAARRRESFRTALAETFDPSGFDLQDEDGKLYLHTVASGREQLLRVHGEQTCFALSAAVRSNRWLGSAPGTTRFGYRFAVREESRSYRELCFDCLGQTLSLREVSPDGIRTLYLRPNFFFTSMDFHIFSLEVAPTAVSVRIDGSLYATIPCAATPGAVAAFFSDIDTSVAGLEVRG